MVSEKVLVVPRSVILPPVGEAFFGISDENVDVLSQEIRQAGFFMDRACAENDPLYKQIIPYFVFHSNERLFVMQRSMGANEKRLAGKVTLGIGGHIRSEDLDTSVDFFDWGLREFQEEVCYEGLLQPELLGFINDDTNAVGVVHLGAVFLVHGDSDVISIRSELVSGVLQPLDSCVRQKDAMESWSQLVCLLLEQRLVQYGTLYAQKCSLPAVTIGLAKDMK